MESRAKAKYIRSSPQKARLLTSLIQGKFAGEALSLLRFNRKAVAQDVEKVLQSAIHNAENLSEDVDVDKLFVKSAIVEEGPRLKRIRPAPMGRAFRYQRRMAHIEIRLEEKE